MKYSKMYEMTRMMNKRFVLFAKFDDPVCIASGLSPARRKFLGEIIVIIIKATLIISNVDKKI